MNGSAKRRAVGVALGLALAAVPVLAQEWSGRGRLEGRITDEDGNPVEGAEITLHLPGKPESGPEPIYTNAKGRFSYLGLSHGAWAVVIEKEGFKVSEGSASVNEYGRTPPLDIELVPNPYSSIDVGDRLLEEGDYATARAAYEEAMEHLPPERQARLRSRIGDTHYRQGDYAAARTEYQAALAALGPDEQVHVRTRIADTYFQEERYAEARAEYEEMLPHLETAEQKVPIYLNMARMRSLEGDNAGAIEVLERADEAQPGDPQILQLLADLLSREGRDDEAEEYLAQMPEGTEVPPDLVMNLGIRHYNQGNLERALVLFDRAVEDNPEMPEVYYYRGLVYLNQGENEAAEADFHKLLELAPAHEKVDEVKSFLEYLEQGG